MNPEREPSKEQNIRVGGCARGPQKPNRDKGGKKNGDKENPKRRGGDQRGNQTGKGPPPNDNPPGGPNEKATPPQRIIYSKFIRNRRNSYGSY